MADAQTTQTVKVVMQQRIDTKANWESVNPTLAAGELGIESDTNKIKIGDGATTWTDLGYKPGVGTSDGGEIFNDYTNNTASVYSHAEGSGVKAGQMGHLITDDGWGDNTSKTYTLTSVDGFAVNDTVSMACVQSVANNVANNADNSDKMLVVDFAKITAINTTAKTITVDTHQPRQSHHGVIYVISKPSVGTISVTTYSHAEGNNTKACGENSHAEGHNTNASGKSSHAEGMGTSASAQGSHAEGNGSNASGVYSHAEGYDTVASGNFSHVEGYGAHAYGLSSHAEGYETEAEGENSHVEGIGNYTFYPSQHVQGRYNTYDRAANYAHIVGNGSSDTARSNAHTLDWNGNAWFAGNVRVGGTYNSGAGIVGAKALATEEYVDSAVSSGVGSIVIDDALSTTSTNAVQNKVITSAMVGQKTTAGGEIFNNYTNNKASAYSHAEGHKTAAGQTGYSVNDDGWNSTSKTYTLNSVDGLVINDTISIYAANITDNIAELQTYGYENFAKIKAIDITNKSITVDNYIDRFSRYAIIYVKTKPNIGSITIAAYSHAEGYSTTASGLASHAEGYNTQATTDYSHAEGYGTKASGDYSHAEGSTTTSSGNYSHAEGYQTIVGTKAFVVDIANSSSTDKKYKLDSVTGLSTNDTIYLAHGSSMSSLSLSSAMTITAIDTTNKTITVDTYITSSSSVNYIYVKDKPNIGTTIIGINANCAHAEGGTTIASGFYSHAEGGNTKACGNNSHAEGDSTTASGSYGAHSEGYITQAIGHNSHAEGHGSIASTDFGTHAEGYYTLALSASQHVQGKFNVGNPSGEYAHIVGNGSNSDNRSNAHTLDWNGNSWYAGNIKIGGASYDDVNAKTLATQEYVDTKVAESGGGGSSSSTADTVTPCTGDELVAISSPSNGSIRYVTTAGTGDNTSITTGLYFYLGGWKKVALEETSIVTGDTITSGTASTSF